MDVSIPRWCAPHRADAQDYRSNTCLQQCEEQELSKKCMLRCSYKRVKGRSHTVHVTMPVRISGVDVVLWHGWRGLSVLQLCCMSVSSWFHGPFREFFLVRLSTPWLCSFPSFLPERVNGKHGNEYMCYTEKAPNAWHRQGTKKTGSTYNQSIQASTGTTHRPRTSHYRKGSPGLEKHKTNQHSSRGRLQHSNHPPSLPAPNRVITRSSQPTQPAAKLRRVEPHYNTDTTRLSGDTQRPIIRKI